MRNRTVAIRQSAFTLIEVLIALAIIGITLAALAGKTLQLLDSANAMNERTYADWIAQNKITELRLSNNLPEVSSSSGEVSYANSEWAWRAVVSETGVENLFRVDVTVNRVVVDEDALTRTVTGFIGEPVPAGIGNAFWQTGPRGAGEIR